MKDSLTVTVDVAVSDLSAGEAESEFVRFFRDYRSKAFHYALQTVGNVDDALDVTQEAFLRLHRHWRRRDPSRPFGPWLYSIVRNLAIDLLRKRATRRECNQEDAPPLLAPAAASPEAAAGRKELAERLWREIGRLPEPQREALLLRDWHGLSYAEIAEITGSTVAAVNSRIHDARVRLRDRLRRYL